MILNGTISVTTFGNCLYTSFFVRRSITPELVSCRCRSRVFTDTVADALLRPVQYRCWKANSDGNMAGSTNFTTFQISAVRSVNGVPDRQMAWSAFL